MTAGVPGTSYDEVPYESYPYAQSHPDRMATHAALLGLQPPPVERCRVLELGCAGGGNLVPMAYGLPGSSFVGIDLSPRQIAEAQELASALDLPNIEFRSMDILDMDERLGSFDYILAHGVYSWVPRPVQDKMLDFCRHNLAPRGVAYISYNAYPGWHLFGLVRDMMLYRTRDTADPLERAAQARALLAFMVEAVPAKGSIYGSFLQYYTRYICGDEGGLPKDDAFILHDEMEAHNEALYFHQFMERAERHGLQYLGEAEFHLMTDSRFSQEVVRGLAQMSRSVIDLEQYMDFVRHRSFRQTLLCHQEATLDRKVKPERLAALYVSSPAQPEQEAASAHTPDVLKLRGAGGVQFVTDHPLTKAALLHLVDAWPEVVPFGELVRAAQARLGAAGPAGADDIEILGANLLNAYGYSDVLVRLHAHALPLVLRPGARPVASRLARLQAPRSRKVTNLHHQRVELADFDRYLLRQLDGSRDRTALVEALIAGPVAEGLLQPKEGAAGMSDPQQQRESLAGEVEGRLRWLGAAALLVG